MARSNSLKFLRTTRAALDAQAVAVNLRQGEPYLITDENRLALGISTSSYQAFSKQFEGTPAGLTTQVQYNNAGVFAGSANFTYNSLGNTLSFLGTNPTIILAGSVAEPAIPSATNSVVYAKSVAGRLVLKYMDNSGWDSVLQQSFMFSNIMLVRPSTSNLQTTVGCGVTSVGTLSTPTLATTNLLAASRRTLFSGVATAGTLISQRSNDLLVWRGNLSSFGGFLYSERFALGSLAAGNRFFLGLSDTLSAPTNIDPITSTTPGKIGLAINVSTGNWNLVNNITGTAPTALTLGANFSVNINDVIELNLYSAPASSSVGYKVKNLSTLSEVSGTLTSNIPSSTTFLAPWKFMTNNAAATAFSFASLGFTLETTV